jgi:hypothetical protein
MDGYTGDIGSWVDMGVGVGSGVVHLLQEPIHQLIIFIYNGRNYKVPHLYGTPSLNQF